MADLGTLCGWEGFAEWPASLVKEREVSKPKGIEEE